MLDLATAVDEDANLPPDLAADLGQLPRKILRQEPVGGNAAPEEALELANLTGLEALRLAEDLNNQLLLVGASRRQEAWPSACTLTVAVRAKRAR